MKDRGIITECQCKINLLINKNEKKFSFYDLFYPFIVIKFTPNFFARSLSSEKCFNFIYLHFSFKTALQNVEYLGLCHKTQQPSYPLILNLKTFHKLFEDRL